MTDAACRCASPRVGWCDLRRAWTPVLPVGRRAALAVATDLLSLDDPRLRAASPEPRR